MPRSYPKVPTMRYVGWTWKRFADRRGVHVVLEDKETCWPVSQEPYLHGCIEKMFVPNIPYHLLGPRPVHPVASPGKRRAWRSSAGEGPTTRRTSPKRWETPWNRSSGRVGLVRKRELRTRSCPRASSDAPFPSLGASAEVRLDLPHFLPSKASSDDPAPSPSRCTFTPRSMEGLIERDEIDQRCSRAGRSKVGLLHGPRSTASTGSNRAEAHERVRRARFLPIRPSIYLPVPPYHLPSA